MTSFQNLLCLGNLGALAIGVVALAPLEAHAGCDLEAILSELKDEPLAGGQSIDWQIEYRNIGDAKCKRTTVVLSRKSSRGGSTANVGGSRGRQRLNALAPGQSQMLSFSEPRPPRSGSYTYNFKFSSPYRDDNNRNHVAEREVEFVARRGGRNPGKAPSSATTTATTPATTRQSQLAEKNAARKEAQRKSREDAQKKRAEAAKSRAEAAEADKANKSTEARSAAASPCELVAAWVAPLSEDLPKGETVEWKIKFTNTGGQSCRRSTTHLARFTGTVTSGSPLTVGGSRGKKSLRALAGGASQTLTYQERVTPQGGTYTYQLKFFPGINDGNPGNQQLQRTIQYGSAPPPVVARCDLRTTLMKPTANELKGGQTHTWEIFIRNDGNGPCEANKVYLTRTQKDASGFRRPAVVGEDRDYKRLPALAGRNDVLIRINENDTPTSGTWTYELKFASPHSDANRQNHTLLKTLVYPGSAQSTPPPTPTTSNTTNNSGASKTPSVRSYKGQIVKIAPGESAVITVEGLELTQFSTVVVVQNDRPAGSKGLSARFANATNNDDRLRAVRVTATKAAEGGTYRLRLGTRTGILKIVPKSFVVESAATTAGAGPTTVKMSKFAMIPKRPEVGENVVFKFEGEAIGSDDTRVPWEIQKSPGTLLSPNARGREKVRTRDGRPERFVVEFNWTAQPGNYRVFLHLDPENQLGEPSDQTGDNLSEELFFHVTEEPNVNWTNASLEARKATAKELTFWFSRARIKSTGCKVEGPVATAGTGIFISDHRWQEEIRRALESADAPNAIARSWDRAVKSSFESWANKVTIPGLPWYPAFAVWPGAVAPPTPSIPTPLGVLVSSGITEMTGPQILLGRLIAAIGPEVVSSEPGLREALTNYSTVLSARFAQHMAQAMLLNVMGQGSVLGFNPVLSPIGMVRNGSCFGGAVIGPFPNS